MIAPAPDHSNITFLRVFGIAFMVLGWLPVLNPEVCASWKGGNRAPLSRKSRWVTAIATTAWCLIAWGVAPLFCAAVFAVCVLYAMELSRQDRAQYSKEIGIPPARRIDPEHWWMGWSAFVLMMWILTLRVLVRDIYWPPVGRDAEILRWMARLIFGFLSVAGLVLYRTRPKKS